MLNRRAATFGFFACTLALGLWSSARAFTVTFDAADGRWYEPVLVPLALPGATRPRPPLTRADIWRVLPILPKTALCFR